MVGDPSRMADETGWRAQLPIERTLEDLSALLAVRAQTRRPTAGMTGEQQHSETARQLVHMAMGGFALLLRWLTWWQALALAASALLFNFFVLPLVAGRLYRAGDDPRRLHGILFYPLSVLMLLLCFPHRPDIVAGAWGILAIGDGLATLVGRAAGGARWPWNRDKTVAGSLAFVAGGTAAAVFLLGWCRPTGLPREPVVFLVGLAFAAAVAAAAVETIPVASMTTSLSPLPRARRFGWRR